MPKEGHAPLRQWFRQARADERLRMAELVGVSYHYVRAVAYGHRKGPLALLMRMAQASRSIRAAGDPATQKRLPNVQRGDVSPVCAECPFYKLCRDEGITENNN